MHTATCFSVYEHINPRSVFNVFVETPRALARLSHQIEKELVERQLPAAVFAGFQYTHRFNPVMPRYLRMTSQANIWIFGQGSHPQADSLPFHFVNLQPDSPLVHEWFIIVDHDECRRALIARETAFPYQRQRQFEGILTSDEGLIRDVSRSLLDYARSRVRVLN